MCETLCYSGFVKTIEEIRMENFRRLVEEIERERGHEMNGPEVAKALGLSSVYVWQLRNGQREAIDSKAARKIELKTGRPKGWLDTDTALWPFPGIEFDRYLRLSAEQKLEIQGSVRKMIIDFEESSGELPGEKPQAARGGGR